jgi:hypothetical protein
MGKLTISMAMFLSFFYVYQAGYLDKKKQSIFLWFYPYQLDLSW